MIPTSARRPLTVAVRRSRISAGRLMSVVAAPDAPLALQRAVCVCSLLQGAKTATPLSRQGSAPLSRTSTGLERGAPHAGGSCPTVRRVPSPDSSPPPLSAPPVLLHSPVLSQPGPGRPRGSTPQTTGGCSCVAGWWSFMKPGQRMEKQSLQAVRPTVILVTVKAAGPVKIFFSYLAR